MTEFHDWEDVRAELLPAVGGAVAVARARDELHGWIRAQNLAETRRRRSTPSAPPRPE